MMATKPEPVSPVTRSVLPVQVGAGSGMKVAAAEAASEAARLHREAQADDIRTGLDVILDRRAELLRRLADA